jgi:hypothetical protein
MVDIPGEVLYSSGMPIERGTKMKASEATRKAAYKRQQAERQASKLHRIDRLKAKMLEDPDGIWGELLAEAREGLET